MTHTLSDIAGPIGKAIAEKASPHLAAAVAQIVARQHAETVFTIEVEGYSFAIKVSRRIEIPKKGDK